MARLAQTLLATLTVLVAGLHTENARACGGFFCNRQPVDQTAERILFEVGPDSVTMTTQISFSGDAEDFAWVLPLRDLPDPESLSVFSQPVLNALDTLSRPVFVRPETGCPLPRLDFDAEPDPERAETVRVFLRAEIGEYSAAVIKSEDPGFWH